jgi:hypothetical protein
MSKILVDTIDTRSGTSTLTLGSSNAGTIALGSGDVQSNFLNPAFEAYRSSNQTPSNSTNTKIQFNTEVFDTDNCYDNSTNFRFTPTVAGKYFVYGSLRGDGESQTDLEYIQLEIKKNNSTHKVIVVEYGSTNDIDNSTITINAVVDMNGSSDYLELFSYLTSSSQPTILGSSSKPTAFGAYRIGT